MEKTTAGLLGALAGLAAMGTAQAATPGTDTAQLMHVASYADLLRPIPNATEHLKASDAELQRQIQARVQNAQYYNQPPPYDHHHHHHHHHHHSQYYPPPPPPPDYHHHHHHHHQGVTIVLPGIGIQTN